MKEKLVQTEQERHRLHKRAEELLAEKSENLDEFSATEVQNLIHEQPVYNTELEIQNRVLLIEDNPGDVGLVQEMLAEAKNVSFKLEHANCLSAGLKLLAEEKFDLLLLDLNLPDSYGLETFQKAQPKASRIPIIALTSLEEESLAVEILKLGAQDYLVKGQINSDLLVRSILYSLERKRAEEVLRKAYNELEIKVQERTSELLETNKRLKNEIIEHERTEERFRLVVESAPNALVMADQNGEIILVNFQTEKLFGYSREELIGQSIEILVPERFRSKHPEYRRDFHSDPQTRPMGAGRDLFALRKDGSEFPVEIGLNPIQTGKGLLVLSSIIDITERKLMMEFQEERLRFETLLSEMSSRFVNLTVNDLDGAFNQCLKDLVEFLGFDRSSIGLFSADMKKLYVTHSYARQGFNTFPKVDIATSFPWYTDKLRQGEILVFSNLPHGLPDEAVAEREYSITEGFKSNLAIPLKVGNSILGVIGFGSFSTNVSWPKEFVQRLKLIGEIFASALARRRAEEALIRRTEQVIHYQSVLLELAKIDNSDLDSALKRITEADSKTLGVERAGVWLFNKDHSEIVCKDLHTLSENLHESGLILKAEDYPKYFQALEKSRVLAANDACADPRTSGFADAYLKPYGITSMMDVPIRLQGNVVGIVCHEHTGQKREWAVEEEDFAASIADMVSLALEASEHKQKGLELQRAFSEIKQLKDQLERENIYLREEIKLENSYDEIVGASGAIRSVLSQAEQVANTGSTVLLFGETGTGKELIARAIHKLSPRKGRSLIKVNCAALPSTLIEAELFGREKGAYTGALSKQIGRFEIANGSTIFLDEISELSLELQSKMLRVLQEGEFERLGSPETIKVDVRVIAATNRNLAKEVQDGKFREDLYYRLNVFPIHIPPLRERKEDIPMLVWSFVKEFGEKMGKRIEKIPRKSMEALQLYSWPGNVRELRNAIERAMILAKDSTLQVDLPKNEYTKSYQCITLEDAERKHILEILEMTSWRIRGNGGASEVLGLKPSTLESKMVKLGIKRKK